MNSLDDLVSASSKEIETENESKLEEIANNTGFFETLKRFTLWDWIKTGSTTAFALLTGGLINTLSVTGTYLTIYYLLNKEKIKYNELKGEIHLGNAMTFVLSSLYKALSIFSPVIRTIIGFSLTIPLFNFIYLGTKHLTYNYTPSKIIKYIFTGRIFKLPLEIYQKSIKPDFVKSLKNIYLFMGPGLVYAWNFVQLKYQLAVTSINRLGYKYFLEKAISKPKYQANRSYAYT